MNNYNYPPNFYFDGNNLRNYQNNYQNDNLFNPYEGLIRGNLFKNIYDPYKNEKPYAIKPMNNQAKMLTDIDSLEFALIDLNLYLDIYPDDKAAIELFNKFAEKYNNKLITGDIIQVLKDKSRKDKKQSEPTYTYKTNILNRLEANDEQIQKQENTNW